jgi:hypothetical protein
MKFRYTSAYWHTDKISGKNNLIIINTFNIGNVTRALFGGSDGFMYKLSSIKLNNFHGPIIYFDNGN